MNDYFEGAIDQLRKRCESLIESIPVGLPREFHVLEEISRREVTEISEKLRPLLGDEDWLKPENQGERLRRFKQLVRDIDNVESICIAALERKDDKNDLFLNRLVERIRLEIGYPLPPLVVTSLSKSENYFQTWTRYRLMLVPLLESQFLLHLPDIYHELGHPILEEKNDPKVRPFQDKLLEFVNEAMDYIVEEADKSSRRNDPQIYALYWDTWSRCWIDWATEFMCDLFAVYVLGPAFAWSHLHLSATRGVDPYHVPLVGSTTRHPPDSVRMEAILEGLTLTGFADEASRIEEKWKMFLAIAQPKAPPEFRRCFPMALVKSVAQKTFDGVSAIGCRIVSSNTEGTAHQLFADAWQEFWRSPTTYVQWESERVRTLRELLSG